VSVPLGRKVCVNWKDTLDVDALGGRSRAEVEEGLAEVADMVRAPDAVVSVFQAIALLLGEDPVPAKAGGCAAGGHADWWATARRMTADRPAFLRRLQALADRTVNGKSRSGHVPAQDALDQVAALRLDPQRVAATSSFAAALATFARRVAAAAGGKPWATDAAPKEEVTKEEEETVGKFHESLWKLTVYSLFTAVGVWVLWDEKYVFDVVHHWTGCAGVPCTVERAMDHRLLYAVEMGFYAFALPHLFLFEVKRKDFWVMLAHHLVTLALIGFSLTYNFMRIGVPVMVLHDACDIFLEGAKALKYTCKHTKRDEFWVERFFELFVVVWVAMRIVYYPFWIIRSALVEYVEVVAGSSQTVPDIQYVFNGFYVLLFGLLAMHVYWTYLIARIAYRQLVHGIVDDDREDD